MMKLLVVILPFLCLWTSCTAASQRAEAMTLLVGGLVNFTCQQSESDNPTFLWYLDDEYLDASQEWYTRYTLVVTGNVGSRVLSSVIQISVQESLDGRQLTCKILYGSGPRNETWILTVIASGAISPLIDDSECSPPFIEGTGCKLKCEINYKTNMAWYINATRLEKGVTTASTTSGTTSVLSFIPSRWDHGRILRCEAPYHGLTETPEQQMIMRVLYLPALVSGKSANHQNTTLWCEADSNPPSKFVWLGFQETQVLISDDHIHTFTYQKNGSSRGYGNVTRSELTLDRTNVSHGGAYKCIAFNEMGMAEAWFELFVSNEKRLFFIIGIPLIIVVICCAWIIVAAICYKRCRRTEKGKKEGEQVPTYATAQQEGSHGLTRLLDSVSSAFSQVRSQASKDTLMSNRPRLSLPRVY